MSPSHYASRQGERGMLSECDAQWFQDPYDAAPILIPEGIRKWNGQRLEALFMDDDHASRQMESIEYHPGNES